MITKHKIDIDVYDQAFGLLAIHSPLEDHALVYKLNQHIKTHLARKKDDLHLGGAVQFPIFEWEDIINDRMWLLFANTCQTEGSNEGDGLFSHEKTLTSHPLIPERREVDYLLKIISDEPGFSDQIVEKLNKIPEIVTCYTIEPVSLKSVENILL